VCWVGELPSAFLPLVEKAKMDFDMGQYGHSSLDSISQLPVLCGQLMHKRSPAHTYQRPVYNVSTLKHTDIEMIVK
jgi:hypothetical protein